MVSNMLTKKLTKHFVVTGYIVFAGKVLLVAHRKLKKWLPPGGHIEEGEIPEETLMREIAEETGIHATIVAARDTRGDDSGVKSLFLPQHIQVEDMDDVHQHIDLVYFCTASDGNILLEEEKLADARWFLPKELNANADFLFYGLTLPKHVSHLSLLALKSDYSIQP